MWEREVSQGAYKSVLQWEMKMKVGANPVEVNVVRKEQAELQSHGDDPFK